MPWEDDSLSVTNDNTKDDISIQIQREIVIEAPRVKNDKTLDFLIDTSDEELIPEADWFEKQRLNELNKAKQINVYDLPIKGSKEIEISASLMKTFWGKDYTGKDIEKSICPRKVYVENILRLYNITSHAMSSGLYFEYGIYGKTANGSDICDDLPRLKLKKKDKDRLRKAGIPTHEWKGEKTTDHKRIDAQIEHFFKKAKEHKLYLDDENAQVQIKLKNSSGITIRGTFDIWPTVLMYENELGIYQPTLANIDLKLTKNVDSTYGDFCWGDPNKMDHTQAYLYSFIMRHIDYKQNPHLNDLIDPITKKLLRNGGCQFLYWVFGIANDDLPMQFKQIAVDYDDDKEKYIIDKIQGTAKLLDYYASTEWDAIPDFNICRTCHLSCHSGGCCEESRSTLTI